MQTALVSGAPVVIDLECDSEPVDGSLKRRRIAAANYKCPGCNLTYVFKEGVLKHLKIDHPSLRVDPDSITNRLSRPRQPEKSLPECTFCSKRFPHASALARHQRLEKHEAGRGRCEQSSAEAEELE